jgi:hypothetical protein
MNERHLIVFPPFSGGHHLAQLMSTCFVDYTASDIDQIYDLNKNNIDGQAKRYSTYEKLYPGHLKGATRILQIYESINTILLTYPNNWQGSVGQRILRRASWMQHDNVVDLHNLIYSAESVAKLLDLPRDSVYEIDSADMNRLTAAELLDKIPNLTPNLDVCELMHQRWQAMISR